MLKLAIDRCDQERKKFFSNMYREPEFEYKRKHFHKFIDEMASHCKDASLHDAIMMEMGFTVVRSPVVFDPLHYLDTVDQEKLPPWLKGPRFPPPPKKEQGGVE